LPGHHLHKPSKLFSEKKALISILQQSQILIKAFYKTIAVGGREAGARETGGAYPLEIYSGKPEIIWALNFLFWPKFQVKALFGDTTLPSETASPSPISNS